MFVVGMNFASGHWYTSSVFWSSASGVIAAVAIGVFGAWVAWRVGYPRRRLYYAITSDTSLLAGRAISGVEVRFGGKPLARPRAVTVALRNGGRRDIARAAFDGTPFRLDINERIVECLEIRTTPPNQIMPKFTADGSVLVMEPVKISRGETVSIDLIVDGKPPMLRDPVQMITDVEIMPAPRVPGRFIRASALLVACSTAILIGAVFTGSVPLVNVAISVAALALIIVAFAARRALPSGRVMNAT